MVNERLQFLKDEDTPSPDKYKKATIKCSWILRTHRAEAQCAPCNTTTAADAPPIGTENKTTKTEEAKSSPRKMEIAQKQRKNYGEKSDKTEEILEEEKAWVLPLLLKTSSGDSQARRRRRCQTVRNTGCKLWRVTRCVTKRKTRWVTRLVTKRRTRWWSEETARRTVWENARMVGPEGIRAYNQASET